MEQNPTINPEKESTENQQAHKESRAMEKQNLEDQKQRQEHKRQEWLRGVFALGVIGLLILIFVLIGLALLAVTWHYIAPVKLHWIPDAKLKTISTVLFSGTLFVFLGLYVRDRV